MGSGICAGIQLSFAQNQLPCVSWKVGIGYVNPGAIRCSLHTWVCSAVLPVNALTIINWYDCCGPIKVKKTD